MTNSEHALNLIRGGQIVGLGTGRAATAFVRALGERVKSGLRVRGVATSEATAALARQLGISVVLLDDALAAGGIDVTIDGADEVDSRMDLVKGWGGAHLREKIVAAASRRLVILVTPEKLVSAVGSRGKLPVEVLPFAARLVERRLADLGMKSIVRQADGKPFVTDNGNVILDVAVSPLEQPRELDTSLRDIPGVVGTGLFIGMATDVFVQRDGWVEAWHAVGLPPGPPLVSPGGERGVQGAPLIAGPSPPSRARGEGCDCAVVRVFPDAARLSQSAAEAFVQIAQSAVAARGRFTIALAGGSTPKRLYELLAQPPYRDRVDWSRTGVFFGDERCVPPDHAESNFRMASEALLQHVPSLKKDHICRMPAELSDCELAAEAYQSAVEKSLGVAADRERPSIDLVLLGMGADGHTASLFPNTTALDEQDRWVVANHVPQLGTVRITLAAPLINAARQVMFLVAGADKASALAEVLEGPADSRRLPSQLIRPTSGGLTWLVDAAAAARLNSIGPR